MFEARFQSFEDRTERAASGARVAALRTELARRGLTGFVVPRSDRHQNEYVPASEERLAWLTGFTGSAGAAIVLMERAVLFVDGRYTLQVREQVDTSLFTIEHLVETPPDRWIETNLTSADRLGYDPWLHTVESAERLAKACAAAGATLVAVEPDLIDAIWRDRPAPPLGAVTLHDLRFAGEAAEEKLARIRAELAKLRADALVVSDPHAVAWAFNIRGADVAHTPLPLAFAVVPQTGRPALFVDGRKLSNDVRDRLEEPRRRARAGRFRAGAGGARASAQDRAARPGHGRRCARAPRHQPTAARSHAGPDPIALMKAVKNQVEIAGARAAHMRDGAAVTRFLAWFDREAPRGTLTEIDAVAALESFRRDTGLLKDVSFPTISGAGPEWRDRALPRHQQDQSRDRARRVVSDQFRRPIPGRHHRHHAHGRGRRADRRDARALHPRAQGSYRDRARGVSRRDHRRAARLVRAAISVGGRGSTSITAPAMASAAISRCTKARRASPSSARRRSSAA